MFRRFRVSVAWDRKFLSGAGGKMKRASVPSVVNKLGHNGFCGYESVPEGVLRRACKRTGGWLAGRLHGCMYILGGHFTR